MKTSKIESILENLSSILDDTLTVNAIAKYLNKSDQSIRSYISSGKLLAIKENNMLSITKENFLIFLEKNYSLQDLSLLSEEILPVKPITQATPPSLDALLEQKIIDTTTEHIFKIITSVSENFNYTIPSHKVALALRDISLNILQLTQPTCEEIIDILENVLCTDFHPCLKIGQVISTTKLSEIFNRTPAEGINFCEKNKQLYCITKIGSDNLLNDSASYNDIFIDGKIKYEGRGKDSDQTMKGSNYHLQCKLDMFNHKLLPSEKNIIDDFIHVFNKISDTPASYQYLGIFDVTDRFVDATSPVRTTTKDIFISNKILPKTKKAIVFEFTPRTKVTKSSVNKHYS